MKKFRVVFDHQVIKTTRLAVVVEAEDRDDAEWLVEEAAERGELADLKPVEEDSARDSEKAEVLGVTEG